MPWHFWFCKWNHIKISFTTFTKLVSVLQIKCSFTEMDLKPIINCRCWSTAADWAYQLSHNELLMCRMCSYTVISSKVCQFERFSCALCILSFDSWHYSLVCLFSFWYLCVYIAVGMSLNVYTLKLQCALLKSVLVHCRRWAYKFGALQNAAEKAKACRKKEIFDCGKLGTVVICHAVNWGSSDTLTLWCPFCCIFCILLVIRVSRYTCC